MTIPQTSQTPTETPTPKPTPVPMNGKPSLMGATSGGPAPADAAAPSLRMLDALGKAQAIRAKPSPTRRNQWLAGTAAALVLVVLALAWWLSRGDYAAPTTPLGRGDLNLDASATPRPVLPIDAAPPTATAATAAATPSVSTPAVESATTVATASAASSAVPASVAIDAVANAATAANTARIEQLGDAGAPPKVALVAPGVTAATAPSRGRAAERTREVARPLARPRLAASTRTKTEPETRVARSSARLAARPFGSPKNSASVSTAQASVTRARTATAASPLTSSATSQNDPDVTLFSAMLDRLDGQGGAAAAASAPQARGPVAERVARCEAQAARHGGDAGDCRRRACAGAWGRTAACPAALAPRRN